MIQSNEFLFKKDLLIEYAGGKGITRQIIGYNKDIMMVKVMFESGSAGIAHAHPHVQTTYVAAGSFEVTIDGKKQTLSEGDGFFVPSGKIHNVYCLECGVLIDTFNPAREDFLSS